MNSPILFIPFTKDSVLFHYSDIHGTTSHSFRKGKRMLQQLLADSTMSVLRQDSKIIQFAFSISLNQKRVIPA